MWNGKPTQLPGEQIAPVVDIYTRQVLGAQEIASLAMRSLNVRRMIIPIHQLPEGVVSLETTRVKRSQQALKESPAISPHWRGPYDPPPYYV